MREAPRYALWTLAVAGLAATARFTIAPPKLSPAAQSTRQRPPADAAAEGYATLFARRYLTWNGAQPQAEEQSLAPFVGSGMEADGGLQLPPSGEQRVEWAEVVQQREPGPGEHVYTIAAQTDTAGLLYLTVGVERLADGALALSGYPAFVGAPANDPAQAYAGLREVDDPALAAVVERGLRNYLAGSSSELAADLTANARVSLPGLALNLGSVQRLYWSTPGGAVLALVQAADPRGVGYTLAYELDVAVTQGRWEISAVQMDPDA